MQVQHTHALLHVYNHILTFTKSATYFALAIKSNFGNYWGINPFISPWVRRWGSLGCRVKLRRTFINLTKFWPVIAYDISKEKYRYAGTAYPCTVARLQPHIDIY